MQMGRLRKVQAYAVGSAQPSRCILLTSGSHGLTGVYLWSAVVFHVRAIAETRTAGDVT
jgi:hypothetical protein